MNSANQSVYRFRPVAVIASAMCALAVVLTSCGGSTTQDKPKAISAEDVALRYGYDVETATELPTYAIVPTFNDPNDMYARMLLLKQCMAPIVEYTVLPPVPDSPTTVFSARSGERRLTVEIAQMWGYHIPPEPDRVSSAPPPAGMTLDQVVAEERACGEKTKKRLGDPPDGFLNDAMVAGWEAADAKNEQISAATAAWKECMAPAGVIDLPSTPVEMPPQSVVSGNEVTEETPPSAREVEVAVADAQCRESSGYTKTIFAVRAHAELEAIGKDIESFEAARAKYDDYMQSINEVINELG